MPTRESRKVHKHFRLDGSKIRRAQKALRTRNETETIEQALDAVIAEEARNRLAHEANERFIRSGVEIVDVYRKLEN